jgi:hypothetical protein
MYKQYSKVLNLPVAGNVPLFRDTYVMPTCLNPYPFPYLMAHCHHKRFLRNKLIAPSFVWVITITNSCTWWQLMNGLKYRQQYHQNWFIIGFNVQEIVYAVWCMHEQLTIGRKINMLEYWILFNLLVRLFLFCFSSPPYTCIWHVSHGPPSCSHAVYGSFPCAPYAVHLSRIPLLYNDSFSWSLVMSS